MRRPATPQPTNRAERRKRAKAANAGPPRDTAGLRARIERVTVRKTPAAVIERARKILLVYIDTAVAEGMPYPELVATLARGLPAFRIGAINLQAQTQAPQGAYADAACAAGCAFCCILSGEDGGTITEHEARTLHAALAPKAGEPDGRAWHPKACPSLDPETRLCRAYDARPMICRSYFSTDAQACEKIAEGEPASGAGVLSAHLTYLVAHAIARAALAGLTQAPTFSMSRVAAGAVDGESIETTLGAARHKPRALDEERDRTARSYSGVSIGT